MRVLWLSPWLRPLARVHAEALIAQGIEVLLVTADLHPESDAARDFELVLQPHPKDMNTWAPFARAWRRARSFRPDVVVSELVRDPRWIAFGRLAPVVQLVHDDRPHDTVEVRPAWERKLFDAWGARSAATVAFSRYVAEAIADRPIIGGPVRVVPLTSDLDPHRIEPPASPGERRDVVLFGRLNPYKNLDVVFRAWSAHVTGPQWRGDRLILLGDGYIHTPLPEHAQWRRGSFSYAEVLPVLRVAKASLAHYRRASQSGVQVTSMQMGVTPIVSTQGALPEFQPPGEAPIQPDDVMGLTAALDSLADPVAAACRGSAAAAHYRSRFARESAAAGLRRVFDEVLARGQEEEA